MGVVEQCTNVVIYVDRSNQLVEIIDKGILKYYIKGGHACVNDIKFLLTGKYNWDYMYKDIDEYCKR
jgi:hypothetical protein